VDAVVQVVRCFDDKDVVHVSDTLDPVADIETIATELVLADLESLGKQKERLEKLARGGQKEAREAKAALAFTLSQRGVAAAVCPSHMELLDLACDAVAALGVALILIGLLFARNADVVKANFSDPWTSRITSRTWRGDSVPLSRP